MCEGGQEDEVPRPPVSSEREGCVVGSWPSGYRETPGKDQETNPRVKDMEEERRWRERVSAI